MPAPSTRARLERRALRLALELGAGSRRARAAARRHWRRLLVGALAGWALASVAGAVVLVVAEELGAPLAELELLAIAGVYAGLAAGAALAYRRRRPSKASATRGQV